jgi:hypothetical protein
MRLPRGRKAQIIGSRGFQTMYTAEQMRKAIHDTKERCAKEADKRLSAGDAGPLCIAAAIRALK